MPPVLTLICPTLPAQLKGLHARGESLSSWPALQRWLERGTAHAVGGTLDNPLEPWQFQLLTALDLDPRDAAYASAPLSWMGEGGGYREGVCLHADPVHLVAGMDHVQLAGVVALSLEESQAMFLRLAALNSAEAEFCMSEHGKWYVWIQRALQVETHSLMHAASSRLDDAMPSGRDGRVLRALMSEVQMSLHDDPLNVLRERRQLLSANAVWLWGQGAVAAEMPRHLPLICADEVYARGLARLHRSQWQPLCANGVELIRGLQQDTVAVASSAELHDFEHRWIAPLMSERQNNNVDCRLILPGWSIRPPGNSWFGWLQRHRPFEEFLN